MDRSVWQRCVLLAVECLVRLQREHGTQRDINHGMNYKGPLIIAANIETEKENGMISSCSETFYAEKAPLWKSYCN